MFNPAKLQEAIALLKDADACQQAADIPADFRCGEYDMDFTYEIHNSLENIIDELETALDLLTVEGA
jgi:hypothetical protein